jgi:hypothetical protein
MKHSIDRDSKKDIHLRTHFVTIFATLIFFLKIFAVNEALMDYIQHCFICRHLISAVPEDSRIEHRNVAKSPWHPELLTTSLLPHITSILVFLIKRTRRYTRAKFTKPWGLQSANHKAKGRKTTYCLKWIAMIGIATCELTVYSVFMRIKL